MERYIQENLAKFVVLLLLISPLRVISVDLDLDPKLIASYSPPIFRALGVAMSGNYAYVTGDSSLYSGASRHLLSVIDISDPEKPRLSATHNLDNNPLNLNLAVSGQVAVVAESSENPNGRLAVFDLADPVNPRRSGTYIADGGITGVTMSGSYAFVTTSRINQGALEVIDMTNPANPVRIGEYQSTNALAHVVVRDDLAFVGGSGLQIIDLKQRVKPTLLGRVYIVGSDFYTGGLTLSGSYAYLLQGGELHIWDITNPATPQRVGLYTTVGTGGIPGYLIRGGPAVSGNHLFCMDSDNYLHTFDVRDPARPILLAGSRRIDGIIGENAKLTISGSILYVAAARGGLEIFDVSNAPRLRWVGGYDPSGEANNIALSGSRAFVANGTAGLQVFDISEPAKPQPMGNFKTSGSAQDVEISGNLAYVAYGRSGLCVVDVRSPMNLQRVDRPADHSLSNSLGNAFGVALFQNYAYVADLTAGLHVMDVTNPMEPRQVGFYYSDRFAIDVAVSGSIACLAELGINPGSGFGGRLQVLGVNDPRRPRVLSQLPFDSSVIRVTIHGRFAYAVVGGGVQKIDLTDPAAPQVVPLDFGASSSAGASDSVYAPAGLHVVDLRNPASPRGVRLGEYWSNDLELSGRYAFLASGEQGLQVIDFQNIANPQRAGRYGTNTFQSVAASTGYVYLAESSRFSVLDISTSTPLRVAAIENEAESVTLLGNNAFVIGGSKLHVVDITEPVTPVLRTSYDLAVAPVEFAVSGEYLYVLDGAAGFRIRQWSFRVFEGFGSTNLLQTGMHSGFGYARSFAMAGRYAYVIAENDGAPRGDGLVILDLADRANPVMLGTDKREGAMFDVVISANRAYVAGYDGKPRLEVLDISDPANLRQLGVCSISDKPEGLPAYPRRIAVSGNYAYLAVEIEGLIVVDIRNPASPQVVARNPNVYSEIQSLSIANGRVLVADGQGLTLLWEYQPIRFQHTSVENRGAARLRVTGPPNVPGRFQRSTDLYTWTDWVSLSFGESASEIVDSEGATTPIRFYRILVP